MATGKPHSLSLFFVHLMKTGGVSFEGRFRAWYGAAGSYPANRGGDVRSQKVYVDHLEARLADDQPTFVSVHMPAWTADLTPGFVRATMLREPVARTVSHLRQIASRSGLPDTPEAVWCEDEFRVRLTNYQTRVFADRGPRPPVDLAGATPTQVTAILGAAQAAVMTGTASDDEVSEEDLREAERRLETFDVVGVTEELEDFAARVADRCGTDLEPPGRENVTPAAPPIADWLNDEIVASTRLDRRLHETARDLARRG